MMTATGVSSATSLSSATTNRRISKISAKSRPTHPCGSKPIEALSSVATAAVKNGSKSASFGRRGMLSVTTIPFFLNLHESLGGFHADAADCTKRERVRERKRERECGSGDKWKLLRKRRPTVILLFSPPPRRFFEPRYSSILFYSPLFSPPPLFIFFYSPSNTERSSHGSSEKREVGSEGCSPDAPRSFRDYFLVKEEVKKVLSKGKAAGVLRLVFHDAGTFEIEDNAAAAATTGDDEATTTMLLLRRGDDHEDDLLRLCESQIDSKGSRTRVRVVSCRVNTGGMNGSIVYELDRPENTGLQKSLKASSLLS
ncbi:hypothetical protein RHMOL_Rhmol07G0197800 [Rhododendron molle]|uniref:Uncharacterized protein n=1 Tax=Rhododendron molle TaxID=49168 RepID=A0ACC0N3R2_RHOML|nr:hypothetical protein RHMOL_Rhmol07G0197800 [Rhododendron molle]